ncbi:hypothetical protein KP509_11G040400 [Ceratopteris richardii]|nr:hypothetical protein KP509_11G040400 [Ceratopteris richardii]
MCQEHIAPDRFTYISSLKACTSIGAVFDGQEMHAEIERCKLFEGDLSIGNALVEMYSCGGFLAKAQEVFDRLLIKDVISWTSLLSGYVEHDQGELAFECFKQMQSAEVPLDAIAFVWTLKACGSMKSITKAQEIHAEIERHGLLIEDELIGSTIVDAYVKCDLLSIAQQVFDNLPIQTLPSWNALIAGYVEDESAEEALRCFREMQLDGVPPDPVTYICILKACGSLGALSVGQDIHAEIERQGLLRTDNVLGNILLDMYSRCGILATAQELCDGLSDRSVVSWTALMRGYAEHGHGEEALQCLERMQTEGLVPNSVTFVCSLKACSGIGAKDKARGIHMEIEKRGLVGTDPVVANTLVDMYARFGTLVTAQLVFDRLPVQDVVAWTALMAGYAQIGESESVFCTYDKMLRQGVVPNAITFIVVLRACSQSGSYGLSQTYFEAMSRRFGIIPGLEHHACIIDLLGRVGHLDEAVARIDEIPVSPNCVVWHSVLSACGKSGHFKCGNQAFEQALCLDVKDAVAYALMSGVCVDGNFKNVVDRVLSHNM